jgi:hypothetical protein
MLMNRPIRIFLCATCLTLLPSLGRTADKLAPAVVDALAPPPMGSVRFTGRLGRELETCRQGRMLGQSVADVVRPFAERSEVKFWQSEFWGKWFTSAALAYRYQPDAKMRAVLNEAVAGLLKTQTADGYIGNYKPTAETQGWDIWGRKYVLLPSANSGRANPTSSVAACGPEWPPAASWSPWSSFTAEPASAGISISRSIFSRNGTRPRDRAS